ncbi:FixH family protein [Alteromonas sp. CYL-A6]|uniref:FixH family protein n=1 Tax=Alteromonas nitratireducens TaxID=3390813 RepID=UPI0034C28166
MNKPWYKQFWPWFLISVPVASFIMSGVMINIATTTENSLVVDDYYKEGKAINLSLDKIAAAKRKNITTDLTIENGAISLKFHSGIPQEGTALKLAFYHTTLEDKDTSVLLSRDAAGIYRGFSEQDLGGKWQITLTPVDDSWKIQKTVSLPYSGVMKFNP